MLMPKLNWKLLTKKRDSSTQGLPPGKENLAWVTNTVTLIYGEELTLQKPSISTRAETDPCFVGVFHTLNQRHAQLYH